MIKNLKGTTWKIKNVKNFSEVTSNVRFTVTISNTETHSYKKFVAEVYSWGVQNLYHIVYTDLEDKEYEVYDYNGTTGSSWAKQQYRTITFSNEYDVTDKNLINWLSSNADFIPKDKYIHIYQDNKKILVDAAIRDDLGYVISERYITIYDKLELREDIDEAKNAINGAGGILESIDTLNDQLAALQNQVNALEITQDELDAISKVTAALQGVDVSKFDARIKNNTININTNKKNIETVDNRITQIDQKVEQNKANIIINTNNIESNKNEIDEVRELIKNFPVTPDDMDGLAAAIEESKEIANNATSTANIALDRVNSANTNANEAKTIANEAKTIASDLRTQVETNKTQSEKNKLDIETLNSLLDSLEKAYQAKDKALDSRIDQVNADIAALELDPTIVGELKTNAGKVPGLEDKITEHTGALSDLAAQISDNITAIGTLTNITGNHAGRLTTAETRINELQAQLDETVKEDELKTLGTTVESQGNDITALQEKQKDNTNRIGALETKAKEHEQEISDIDTLLQEKIEELSSQGNQLQQLRDDFDDLELTPSDVANIKYTMNELDESVDNVERLITEVVGNVTENTTNIYNLNQDMQNAENDIKANRDIIDQHALELVQQESLLEELQEQVNSKQGNLTAGTNIEIVYDEETKETIINSTAQVNNNWGGITGDISNQTDLQEILNTKVEVTEEEINEAEISLQGQIDDLKAQLQILQNQLNGLTFVPTTQDEYEDLGTYDENTVYIAKEN